MSGPYITSYRGDIDPSSNGNAVFFLERSSTNPRAVDPSSPTRVTALDRSSRLRDVRASKWHDLRMISIRLWKTNVLDTSTTDSFLAFGSSAQSVSQFVCFPNGTQWESGRGPRCLASCVRPFTEPVAILFVSVSMHEVSLGPFHGVAFGLNPPPPIKARGYLPADPPPTF